MEGKIVNNLMGLNQLSSPLLPLLRSFASCELSLDRLREKLRGVVGIRDTEHWLNLDKLCSEPTIRITRAHIERALAMRRGNAISESELIDWATTLLTNSVFYWDGEDAKTVSEWINGIGLDLVPWCS